MANAFLAYFNIHRRFRNGVYALLLLTSILATVLFILDQKVSDDPGLVVLEDYEAELNALKAVAIAKKTAYAIQPFNPNFISDYKGYVLGVSPEAIDKLRGFRANGKWVNSSKDFQDVTGVSDSLLMQLAPFFKFPKRKILNKNKSRITTTAKSYAEKLDLNTTSASELEEVASIPYFIAERIIAYRKKIGGFVNDIQLRDVYGLYPKQMKKVLSLFTVKEKVDVTLLDVNQATVKELVAVPYLDFETALAMRDFIKEHGEVRSFYEFDKIDGFPVGKINRIALYLKIKENYSKK